MNAILASTSALAIATGFYQPTAKVIPFTPRAVPETPALAEETANDNEPAPVMHDNQPAYDSDGIDALEESYADEPEAVTEEIAAPVPAEPAPPAKDYAIGAAALIERAVFTRAVDIIGNVVDKRNTIPILDNVKLTADEQEVILTGTDLDIEIQVRIPAAIDAEFGTTLPAHLLKGLLKKATASDYVAIKTGDERDSLDFERVQYTLNPLPVKDFPELKGPGDDAATFNLPGAKLWAAFDSTRGAISTEETRYYLNGVFLHVHGHDDNIELRMVATDGHRLYCQTLDMPGISNTFPLNGYGSFSRGVIIPRHLVDLLHKLMKGKACPASVAISVDAVKSRFSFMLGDCQVIVTSKHIDGTFPDYGRAVPAHNPLSASFKVADMLEALRAVSLISSERGRAARYTFENGKCDLYVANPDQGTASASIACEIATDDESRADIIIGFNSGYMGEILDVAAGDGETVTIKMSEPGNPALITGDRPGWFGVVMPMRV